MNQLPLLYPLIFFAVVALGLACASVERLRVWVFAPVLALLAVGVVLGVFAWLPALAIALLAAAVYGYAFGERFAFLNGRACLLLNWLIVPLSLAIGFRAFGGVANPLLLEAVQVSEAARSFDLSLSWDKALLALLLWTTVMARANELRVSALRSLWLLPLMLAVVFTLGVLSGYVAADLKWPGLTLLLLWGLSNLLITCVLEEAFFRGIIQRQLVARWGMWIGVLVASLIFGIAHLGGGWLFVMLATVAGVFYGLAYARSGRLWLAVLFHFAVNLTNFIAFTYPALA